MGKITIKEFASRHPDGVRSITNRDYTRVANGVLDVLRRTDYWEAREEANRMDMATILTHYFEDVVSEAGLWRSFVEKHTELYGKPLPFFDIEGEYDPDRLHVEDIQLLMWDYMISDEERDGIPNPINPWLAAAANSVYDYLEGLFEDTPINDDLYDFFHEASFANSYYEVRNVLAWYFSNCYLTTGRFRESILEKESVAMEKLLDKKGNMDDMDPLGVTMAIMANASTRYPIGPLALLPKDWLAALMRVHGLADIAADIEAIDARSSCPYLLEEYDKRFVTLRSSDDELLRVERTFYFYVSESVLRSPNTTGCIGSFASYRGEWFLSGMSSWGDYAPALEKYKDRQRAMANFGLPDYDKYAAKAANKGEDGLLLFFKTPEEYNRFREEELQVLGDEVSLADGEDGLVLFAPKRVGGGLYVVQGNAAFIKSPDNPMYDPEQARGAGLIVANVEGLPGEFCRYLISHNLIPDAAFNSIDGYASGRSLLQDNLDFVARTLRRHYY